MVFFGTKMGGIFFAKPGRCFYERQANKVKILHVNEYYSLEGGLEQYIMRLCRQLEREGHENMVVYGNRGTKTVSHERKSLFLSRITDYECPDIASKLDKLEHLISRERPDVILIHQVLNPKLIDFLAKSRPHIRFVHGYKLTCPGGRKVLKRINKICEYPLSCLCQLRAYQYRCMPRNPRLGLRLINGCQQISAVHKKYGRLMVASGFMKQVLIENGFQAERIAVIPYFTSLPPLPEEDEDRPPPQVLCVSRLTPEKGVDHLLAAFGRVNAPAELIIAGDGPSLAELKEKAKALDISSRVTFTGWLSNSELSRLYHRSSLVVVPSIWPEPFGIVGIEAMAHGKPVVAFDVGGISEWLMDAKTGYKVRRGDEAGLAEKINHLLEHKDEAAAMGRQGRRVAEQRFTRETHIRKLLRLVEDALSSQS
jgi:glycosyltransferase involved in cell wall biosynthesis